MAEENNPLMRGIGLLALAVFGVVFIVSLAYAFQGDGVKIKPHYIQSQSTVKVIAKEGHGSGFYIGNGIVITAAHVVDGAQKATLKLQSGELIDAEILWLNKSRDVAALKIGPTTALDPAPVSCTTPQPGDMIYSEGNPANIEFVTVWGRVAGEARSLGPWKSVVPTDMTTIPGQSGGPVFNEAGEVVGITAGVMVLPMGFSASLVSVGYIVPASTICELMGR